MKEEQRQAIVAQVKKRYQVISPHLTEQAKRLWAASEARAIGRGGTTLVSEATGMSRVTITINRSSSGWNVHAYFKHCSLCILHNQ